MAHARLEDHIISHLDLWVETFVKVIIFLTLHHHHSGGRELFCLTSNITR
ncbi:hypothetical protein HanPI659440_Chr00c05g0713151 [Helianthus annuus]|nr:hypothetical protein HanPI659440_Chr00c05g0713151 [Helianthus annuus]